MKSIGVQFVLGLIVIVGLGVATGSAVITWITVGGTIPVLAAWVASRCLPRSP